MLVSIDPGLRKVGWALFELEGERLVTAGLARAPGRDRDARAWLKMADATHEALAPWCEAITKIAYEMPQIYTERDNKRLRQVTKAPLVNAHNPDNLFQLVGVLGAVLLPFGHCNLTGYRPRQWKPAGTPKEVTQHQIGRTLAADELIALERSLDVVPSSMHHDVLDAVSLGLVALRRGPKPNRRHA